MPADGIRLFEVLELLWQDVAGLHEVSQGRLPSADTSGVAISLLQEQDLSQLGFAGRGDGAGIRRGYAESSPLRAGALPEERPAASSSWPAMRPT